MKFYAITHLNGEGNPDYIDPETDNVFSSTGELFEEGDEDNLRIVNDDESRLSVNGIIDGALIGLDIVNSKLYDNDNRNQLIDITGGHGVNAKARILKTKPVRVIQGILYSDEEIANKVLKYLQGWSLKSEKDFNQNEDDLSNIQNTKVNVNDFINNKKMGKDVDRIDLQTVLDYFDESVEFVSSQICIFENAVPFLNELIYYSAVYRITAACLWDMENPSVIVKNMQEGTITPSRSGRLMRDGLNMLESISLFKVSGMRGRTNRQR